VLPSLTNQLASSTSSKGTGGQSFVYSAKDRQGRTVSGEIDATSLTDARARLRSQGLFLTSIAPAAGGKNGKLQFQLSFRKKIKKRDILMLFSQLTIMCQSGVDLAEALRSLTMQCQKPALKKVMQSVTDDVMSGSTLSESLRRHPAVFDPTFVAGIASGEKSSSITPVLERLTQLMRADLRLSGAVWSMLSYPIVLCVVTVLVVIALLFFVLPQFSKVFEDLEQPVPPLTRMLLGIGDFVRDHLILVIGTLAGCVFGALAVRNSAPVRRFWDYATLNVAVIRNATRALCTGRAFRLLGTMLSSGVSLVDAIRLASASTHNSVFRDLFEKVEQDVLLGEGLGKTLLASPVLPPSAAQMIATAERTGRLDEVLKTVGEYFEDEGERYLRGVIKLLEPAVIVFLGVIVGAVVLSVILPLLDISTASHQ